MFELQLLKNPSKFRQTTSKGKMSMASALSYKELSTVLVEVVVASDKENEQIQVGATLSKQQHKSRFNT